MFFGKREPRKRPSPFDLLSSRGPPASLAEWFAREEAEHATSKPQQSAVVNGDPYAAYTYQQAVHLVMIQAVIDRMAGNSSRAKYWSVLVVTAAIALMARAVQPGAQTIVRLPLFIAPLAAIIFWVLDAYFLRYERLYRGLFNAACEPSGAGVAPFSMIPLDLPKGPFASAVGLMQVVAIGLRPTVFWMHCPLVAFSLYLECEFGLTVRAIASFCAGLL